MVYNTKSNTLVKCQVLSQRLVDEMWPRLRSAWPMGSSCAICSGTSCRDRFGKNMKKNWFLTFPPRVVFSRPGFRWSAYCSGSACSEESSHGRGVVPFSEFLTWGAQSLT